MFIINAPMLFSGIWAVIKPWLDEKTKNKITIIGSGYKEKLFELVFFIIFIEKRQMKKIYQNFQGGHVNVKGSIVWRGTQGYGIHLVKTGI